MAPRKSGKVAANRERDAANPLYHEAEERVHRWLVARGKDVKDVRDQRTYYDFIIGSAWTLDVKCDDRARDTGRVIWESVIIVHGREDDSAIQDGWGLQHGLSYVAYILLPEDRAQPWPLLVVQAQLLREAVHQAVSDGLVGEKEALKPFSVVGDDRTSGGYAVRIDWLRAKGLVLEEGEV